MNYFSIYSTFAHVIRVSRFRCQFKKFAKRSIEKCSIFHILSYFFLFNLFSIELMREMRKLGKKRQNCIWTLTKEVHNNIFWLYAIYSNTIKSNTYKKKMRNNKKQIEKNVEKDKKEPKLLNKNLHSYDKIHIHIAFSNVSACEFHSTCFNIYFEAISNSKWWLAQVYAVEHCGNAQFKAEKSANKEAQRRNRKRKSKKTKTKKGSTINAVHTTCIEDINDFNIKSSVWFPKSNIMPMLTCCLCIKIRTN